jgi:hypothetical protein
MYGITVGPQSDNLRRDASPWAVDAPKHTHKSKDGLEVFSHSSKMRHKQYPEAL